MSPLMRDKLFLVLVALLALTVCSWLAIQFGVLAGSTLGVLILVLAFVKVRLIVIHYMEAAAAEPVVRWAFEGWLVLVVGMMIVLYVR